MLLETTRRPHASMIPASETAPGETIAALERILRVASTPRCRADEVEARSPYAARSGASIRSRRALGARHAPALAPHCRTRTPRRDSDVSIREDRRSRGFRRVREGVMPTWGRVIRARGRDAGNRRATAGRCGGLRAARQLINIADHDLQLRVRDSHRCSGTMRRRSIPLRRAGSCAPRRPSGPRWCLSHRGRPSARERRVEIFDGRRRDDRPPLYDDASATGSRPSPPMHAIVSTATEARRGQAIYTPTLFMMKADAPTDAPHLGSSATWSLTRETRFNGPRRAEPDQARRCRRGDSDFSCGFRAFLAKCTRPRT